MQIIASAGDGARLLIGEDAKASVGRVWVRRTNELYPEHSIDAVVKFGGWEPYDGDEDADAIISGASALQTPGPTSS
jgi:hypothetical protein